MNNWVGLVIAISLALVAGVLNWKYLERKTEEVEIVNFLAIKQGVFVEAGERFQEEHFEPLSIPKKSVGSLDKSAVLFADIHTVVSSTAIRDYAGGQVVLLQELVTPSTKLDLSAGEEAYFVAVGGTFVPSLFSPGDLVNFMIPAPRRVSFRNNEQPQPNESENEDDPKWAQLTANDEMEIEQGPTKFIGPFRVISVGGRLGNYEVNRAQGRRAGGEKILGVALKKDLASGLPDAKSKALVEATVAPGFRYAVVSLVKSGKQKN